MHHKTARIGEEAMSPVIGTVLIMALMVTIVGTMLAWGIPQVQDNEAWAQYATTRSNLLNLDADLDQVLLQGEGASRSTTVSIGLGTFVVRDSPDTLVISYSSVGWVELATRSLSIGDTSFRLADLQENVTVFNVTLSYPDGSSWSGSSDEGMLSDFPAAVSGLRGSVSDASNSTTLGGFWLYRDDALSYRYASTAGLFQMRMVNGGLLAREPGGSHFFEGRPLVRGIGALDALTFYQVTYNNSGSPYTALTGPSNFDFQLRNQGGRDHDPVAAYTVRLAVEGSGQAAYYSYFNDEWGFSRDFQQDEVYLQQSAPLDLRIYERTVHVAFQPR
ncbi:MAG: hypothetical protein MK219_03415 [Candidatus Poseidoniia archaeon]|nr:hypothetical protein [Candidatus Poseidoniia archaeon]